MSSRTPTPRQGANLRDHNAFVTYEASMFAPGQFPHLPHAGFQSDLIHVNNLLIQLSEARASERENSRNLVAGVEAFRAQLANGNIKIVVRGNNDDVVNALEGMGLSDSPNIDSWETHPAQQNNIMTNGHTTHPEIPTNNTTTAMPNLIDPYQHIAQISDLESQIERIKRERDHYKKLLKEERGISDLYQRTIDKMMVMIREYCHNTEMLRIKTKKEANDELQAERDGNLQARLDHSYWQEGLGRAFQYGRMTHRSISEESEDWIRERADLQYENRFLRRMVGWDADDSDEEAEAGPEPEEGPERDTLE